MASSADPRNGSHEAGSEQGRSGRTVQLVSFTVGNEEYGVDIMAVREIRAWSETTPLPNTPEVVRGVINMRGAIVPIFDLRARRSEEHTSELQSLMRISYAVFCMKNKNHQIPTVILQ